MTAHSSGAGRTACHRGHASRLIVAGVLILVGLTATGCATPKNPTTGSHTAPLALPTSSAIVVDDIPSLVVKVEAQPTGSPGSEAPISLIEYFLDAGMRHREEDLEIEQTTAACMQQAGWRYIPAPGTHDNDLLTVGDLQAYRSAYGYGVVSRVEGNKDGGPNLPIYASLSPNDRPRYLDALVGPDAGVPDADRDLPDLPPAGSPGCRSQAQRTVRLKLPRYDETLKAYLATNRIDKHPLLVEADRRWGECMKVRGFHLEDQDDLSRKINELGLGARPTHDVPAEEKRLAQADLACHLAVQWRTRRAVETALLVKISERFPRYAQQIKQLTG